MPEDTQTNEVTTEQPSPVPQVHAVPAQPVQSPPVGQQSTISPSISRDMIYADDGKPWREKAHGYQGALKQVRTELDSKVAALNARIQELEALLETERGAATGLQERIAEVPALQQQVDQLLNMVAVADRQRMLMEYPTLLQLRVEEEVPGEGEGAEPTMVTVNPLLRLIENTTLEGDELRQEIGRLASLYGQAAQPTEPQSPAPPVTPTPAEPVDTQDSLEYWRAESKAIHERMNAGDQSPEARARFKEVWSNIRRLEIAATS